MKNIIVILTLLSATAEAHSPTLTQVRKWFLQSNVSEKDCHELLRIEDASNNPVLLAYKSCGRMMSANFGLNPFVKLASFNQGKNELESCILNAPEQAELRYLRFMIQSNAPTFLNYHGSIEKDKVFLLAALPKVSDKQLAQMIASCLLQSTHVTIAEKQYIKTWQTT
jgi:hypothetical protein